MNPTNPIKSSEADAPVAPAPTKPTRVRVRMTVGPAGAEPRPWITNAELFGLDPLEVTLTPQGVEVPSDFAAALTNTKHAALCRGRRFEIIKE